MAIPLLKALWPPTALAIALFALSRIAFQLIMRYTAVQQL